MRRPVAAFLALALLAGATPLAMAAERSSPQIATQVTAHVEKTFLIPSSDGYGVGECLSGGASECGQVVANAWCEAQGYASAASYGVAARDEYTGAIDTAPIVKAAEAPIRITCQD